MESTLLRRWTGGTERLEIIDEASVSLARQQVRAVGQALGFEKIAIEEMAVVISELATNLLRHGERGWIVVHEISRVGIPAIEVIAADSGPGIENLHDAVSGRTQVESRSLKAGLSGSRRLSDELDIDTRRGEGTCIKARKFLRLPSTRIEVAIVGRPFPGELVSGDDALSLNFDKESLFSVADGYGHGEEAKLAAEDALECAEAVATDSPVAILETVEKTRNDGRGVMLGVAKLNLTDGHLTFAGCGDVKATLFRRQETFSFTCSAPMANPRSIGNQRRSRLLEEPKTLKTGDLLVIHTDGLKSAATLLDRPDLLQRPAASIAEYLLQEFAREHDDALVFVLRVLARN